MSYRSHTILSWYLPAHYTPCRHTERASFKRHIYIIYRCFQNRWSPQIIHLNWVFHDFHHPFWGTVPLFLETSIYIWRHSRSRNHSRLYGLLDLWIWTCDHLAFVRDQVGFRLSLGCLWIPWESQRIPWEMVYLPTWMVDLYGKCR